MVENTFKGLRQYVGNTGVRSFVDRMMALRQQLALKPQFHQVDGWDDPLNHFLAEELAGCRKLLSIVTTNQRVAASQAERQAAAEADAKDKDQTLMERYQALNPLTVDDIEMPRRDQRALRYDFSGADKNFPQFVSDQRYVNPFLLQFSVELDSTIKEATCLPCQGACETIPQSQSAILHAKIDSLFTILQQFGGEAKRRKIADGTSAVQAMADDVVGAVIVAPAVPAATK